MICPVNLNASILPDPQYPTDGKCSQSSHCRPEQRRPKSPHIHDLPKNSAVSSLLNHGLQYFNLIVVRILGMSKAHASCLETLIQLDDDIMTPFVLICFPSLHAWDAVLDSIRSRGHDPRAPTATWPTSLSSLILISDI